MKKPTEVKIDIQKAWEDRTKEELEYLFRIASEHLHEFGFVSNGNGIYDFVGRLKEWDQKRRNLELRCPSGYHLTSHNRTHCGCECGVR